MSCPNVILSRSKDERANQRYLMPILRAAQDDIGAMRRSRGVVACT